jgi:hypothetical protein
MMGHLAELIKGNPAYDDRVQLVNGTPTFNADNGFTASSNLKVIAQDSLARQPSWGCRSRDILGQQPQA